jgi:hypothetical protein
MASVKSALRALPPGREHSNMPLSCTALRLYWVQEEQRHRLCMRCQRWERGRRK